MGSEDQISIFEAAEQGPEMRRDAISRDQKIILRRRRRLHCHRDFHASRDKRCTPSQHAKSKVGAPNATPRPFSHN